MKENNKLTYDLQKAEKVGSNLTQQLEETRSNLEKTNYSFAELNRNYKSAVEKNEFYKVSEEQVLISKNRLAALNKEIVQLENVKSRTEEIVSDLKSKSKNTKETKTTLTNINNQDIFTSLEMFSLEGCEVAPLQVLAIGMMGSNAEFAEWALRIAFELSTIANIPLSPQVYNAISMQMSKQSKNQFFEFIEVLTNKAYGTLGMGDAKFQFTSWQRSSIALAMQKVQKEVNQLIKFQSFETKQKSMRLIK